MFGLFRKSRAVYVRATVAILAGFMLFGCQSKSKDPAPTKQVSSAYPVAVEPAKVGTYSALTKSGGGYFYDDVLEYRVWVHPREGGDDSYQAFPTYEAALEFSKGTKGSEPPLVLVRQREWIDEPQPGSFIPKKGERITEWQVEWLKSDKRGQDSIAEFIASRKGKGAPVTSTSQPYPMAEGRYRLTKRWSIDLPGQFKKRIEGGDLCLWRPGLTIWLTAWNNDKNEGVSQRVQQLRADISPAAHDIAVEQKGSLSFLSCRLAEKSDDRRHDAFYGFVVSEDGHLQVAIYFDDERDAKTAQSLLKSVEWNKPEQAASKP